MTSRRLGSASSADAENHALFTDTQGRGSPAHRVSRTVTTGALAGGAGLGTFRVVPDVILPVLDEALAIPDVVAGLPPGYRAIVVDNASTDDSAAVAEACGATVVHEPVRGFGAACFRGLSAATDDVVCFMDCDGSLSGGDLPALVAALEGVPADLVLGARVPEPGSWPAHARWANRVLALEVRRRTGVRLDDLGPMRVARRESLLALGLMDRRFGWPLEMVLRAAAQGWRIEEVPVGYAPRVGSSKVTGTVRGTVRTVRDMARVAAAVR